MTASNEQQLTIRIILKKNEHYVMEARIHTGSKSRQLKQYATGLMYENTYYYRHMIPCNLPLRRYTEDGGYLVANQAAIEVTLNTINFYNGIAEQQAKNKKTLKLFRQIMNLAQLALTTGLDVRKVLQGYHITDDMIKAFLKHFDDDKIIADKTSIIDPKSSIKEIVESYYPLLTPTATYLKAINLAKNNY